MKLEAGQVWQLDTQEEFDAFMKMKDEQGVEWNCFEWSLGELKSHVLGVYVFDRDGKVCLSVEDRPISTHYGKDLLKEDNMFKVGDRVKVVKGSDVYTGNEVGKKGKITGFKEKATFGSFSSGYETAKGYEVETNDSKYWHKIENLSLVEEPKWKEVEREDNIGSENGTLIVLQNTETKELRVTRGCFTGTLDEFEARVKLKPEGDKHRIVYEWLIEKYKAKYPGYKKKVAYAVKLNEKSYLGKSFTAVKESKNAVTWQFEENAKMHTEDFGGTVEEVEL